MHVRCPTALERKLHLLARRLVLPHPAGGVIGDRAAAAAHAEDMDMFGFDTKQYDPIVDAPDRMKNW